MLAVAALFVIGGAHAYACSRRNVVAKGIRVGTIDVPILYPRPKVTVAALRRRYPSFITIDRAAF